MSQNMTFALCVVMQSRVLGVGGGVRSHMWFSACKICTVVAMTNLLVQSMQK